MLSRRRPTVNKSKMFTYFDRQTNELSVVYHAGVAPYYWCSTGKPDSNDHDVYRRALFLEKAYLKTDRSNKPSEQRYKQLLGEVLHGSGAHEI